MKTKFLVCLSVMILTSLISKGQCASDFIGSYWSQTGCAANGSCVVNAIIATTSVQDSIIITNPFCFNGSIHAILDCDSQLIHIPAQQYGNYTIQSGFGYFILDSFIHVVISFTGDSSGNFESCSATLNSEFHYSTIYNIPNYNINLFPNPVSEFINIPIKEMKNIFISNLSGQLCRTIRSDATLISVADLCSGIYFVKIQLLSGNIVMKKFVKE